MQEGKLIRTPSQATSASTSPADPTPFPWPTSGLSPLPWFPFTVASSRDTTAAAERIATRTERAYWHLRKRLGELPRFRLLVLDRTDWPRFADRGEYGLSHFTAGGNLVVGSGPAAAWHDVSRELDRRLPEGVARGLVRTLGPDPRHGSGADLSLVAESLVAHDLARFLADRRGARFAAPWLLHAFANYALVSVLGETEPAALHRLGALAQAAHELSAQTLPVTLLASPGRRLTPFDAVLVQLALTRAVYLAYAERGDAPLANWFERACAAAAGPVIPDADHELGRMLADDVHPALGELVTMAQCNAYDNAA